MEQLTDAIGNPTALLVERIFWLGLGAFLGLAIITSLLRGLKEGKNKTTPRTGNNYFFTKRIKRRKEQNDTSFNLSIRESCKKSDPAKQ